MNSDLEELANELDGWHDCADGDVSAGNGHFRLQCVSDSEQQRLNLRATLRQVASALRRLASQDQKPPPAAGWDDAIEAAKKIAHGYDDDVYEDEDMNAVRRQVVKFIARDIEALRTTPAATKSDDAVGGVREEGECHPVLKHMDEVHDLGFKAGWEAALSHQPAPVARDFSKVEVDPNFYFSWPKPAPVAANASAEARLREALEAVEPYLDAIVCYASSINEHHGNEVAKLVREALSAHTHVSVCDKQGCMGDTSPGDAKDLQELLNSPSVLDETTKSEGGVEGHAGRPWPSPKTDATNDGAMASLSRPSPVAGIKPGPSDRTADVTEEQLTEFLYELPFLIVKPFSDDDECHEVARALLDAYGMWRR